MEFLNQAAAATFLGVSVRTLEAWRVTGRGPVFRKLGRRVTYAKSDLEKFADAARRTSTSDPGTAVA